MGTHMPHACVGVSSSASNSNQSANCCLINHMFNKAVGSLEGRMCHSISSPVTNTWRKEKKSQETKTYRCCSDEAFPAVVMFSVRFSFAFNVSWAGCVVLLCCCVAACLPPRVSDTSGLGGQSSGQQFPEGVTFSWILCLFVWILVFCDKETWYNILYLTCFVFDRRVLFTSSCKIWPLWSTRCCSTFCYLISCRSDQFLL